MSNTTPGLGARLRPLILFGLAVAAIRFVLEFIAPTHAMLFGVYYAMPLAFAVLGWRHSWGPIRWLALLGTMALLALVVWGIPNTISYTTAQFLEWNHGRFHYGGKGDPDNRGLPLATSALGKIASGAAMGGMTSIAGTVWCTVWGTVLIWLPGKLRARSARSAAA